MKTLFLTVLLCLPAFADDIVSRRDEPLQTMWFFFANPPEAAYGCAYSGNKEMARSNISAAVR